VPPWGFSDLKTAGEIKTFEPLIAQCACTKMGFTTPGGGAQETKRSFRTLK
jgi:hypothetical protein